MCVRERERDRESEVNECVYDCQVASQWKWENVWRNMNLAVVLLHSVFVRIIHNDILLIFPVTIFRWSDSEERSIQFVEVCLSHDSRYRNSQQRFEGCRKPSSVCTQQLLSPKIFLTGLRKMTEAIVFKGKVKKRRSFYASFSWQILRDWLILWSVQEILKTIFSTSLIVFLRLFFFK